jgi:succinate dehydrogenase/fumarate reductase flavoprotein subunit
MAAADVDVVVVGSGAAGLTAALTARAEGARVAIAESETVVGGATRLSAGWVMAADTEPQRRAGLHDSAENLFHEYMFINQFGLQPALVRRLAEGGADAISWLLDQGVRFDPDIKKGGPELVPRTHAPEGYGQGVVDLLERHCREQGIDIALAQRVDRLLTRRDAVVGVAAGDDELEAGAVVLATGGFGANRALVDEHLPSLGRLGDWVFYIGPESSRGDALALAGSVGAAMIGHDHFISLPVPRPDGLDFDSYLPAWMLVVGPDARRLCDETSPYGITCGLLTDAGGRVFGFFDEEILAHNGTPELPTFKPHPSGALRPVAFWTSDTIRRCIDGGSIVRADSLEELFSMLDLPVAATAGAVRRYNESASLGEDRDFGKDARFVRPIEKPPFYGVELRPAAIGATSYGVQIDASAQVLGKSQALIEGLFAAGECTGGTLGSRYLSSGNSLGNCFVFGRVAGRSAARHALGGAAQP